VASRVCSGCERFASLPSQSCLRRLVCLAEISSGREGGIRCSTRGEIMRVVNFLSEGEREQSARFARCDQEACVQSV
jgi:hypothetical protein